MECLNTETLNCAWTTSYANAQSNGYGPYKIEVPQPFVTAAKPLTYRFRVAEYVDSTGKIMKVNLQFSVYEHTNMGGGCMLKQDWKDVERIQLPFVG